MIIQYIGFKTTLFYKLKPTGATANPQQIRVSVIFIMPIHKVHLLSVSLHAPLV